MKQVKLDQFTTTKKRKATTNVSETITIPV